MVAEAIDVGIAGGRMVVIADNHKPYAVSVLTGWIDDSPCSFEN